MCLVMLPFAITSIYGYTIYRSQISKPFQDVLNAQHRVLVPLERIQDVFWDISTNVNDYSEEGGELHRKAFEASEQQVFEQLIAMEQAITDNKRYEHILHSVWLRWHRIMKIIPDIKVGSQENADPNIVAFEDEISRIAKQLGQLAEKLRIESENTHREGLVAQFDV